MREEKGHLAVLREYYCYLPSGKVAKQTRLILGINIVVWGLQWGSPGSHMPETWPHAMDEVG